MSCAGCDDCPSTGYHLHVTVGFLISDAWEDKEWNKLIDLMGYKPILVHNVTNNMKTYEERIPTQHVKGTEAEAIKALFMMGWCLINVGFAVKRLKIETNPSSVNPARVLYYESHVKNLRDEARARARNLRVPMSRNERGEEIFTVRHPAMGHVYELATSLTGQLAKIEATILDTAPELDKEWMR